MSQIVDLLNVRTDEDIDASDLLDSITLSLEHAESLSVCVSTILDDDEPCVSPHVLASMLHGITTHLSTIRLLSARAYELIKPLEDK